MRFRHLVLILAIALVGVAGIASGVNFLLQDRADTTSPVTDGLKENQEMARQFLINSPTFKFDEMEETLKLEESAR